MVVKKWVWIPLYFLFHAVSTAQATLYSNDFEGATNWGYFEEIVGGNTCYGSGLAAVDNSTDFAYSGAKSLRVWSNFGNLPKSNHVIGNYQLYSNGLTGIYKFSFNAYLPAPSTDGQTGPEWSVQSTRDVSGSNLTYTAGIQYVRNPWVTEKWQIWHNGAWAIIDPAIFNIVLDNDTWYAFEMFFDYGLNKYLSLKIVGGTTNLTLDLQQAFTNAPGGYTISGENKGFSPATWLTLESENLWTSCTQTKQQKVYYDDLSFQDHTLVVPLSLLSFEGSSDHLGHHLTWRVADAQNVSHFEVERSEDGQLFSPIGQINFSTSRNYDFLDTIIDYMDFNGTGYYYRLKTIDLDGHFEFSHVVFLKKETIQELIVFPNPTTKVLYLKNIKETAYIIYNSFGQILLQSDKLPPSLDLKDFENGIYWLKSNGAATRFILVKN